MQRIMIIGSPGSGKTTLSGIIAEKLGLPMVHLDRLGWKSGWVIRPREEFDAMLAEELTREQWIIDGNYNRTIDVRLERADTVIMLDYPTYICVLRVLKRFIMNLGRTRPDMTEGCPERLDMEFLIYVCNFRRKYRQKLLDKLKEAQNVNVIIIRNKREYRKFLLTL